MYFKSELMYAASRSIESWEKNLRDFNRSRWLPRNWSLYRRITGGIFFSSRLSSCSNHSNSALNGDWDFDTGGSTPSKSWPLLLAEPTFWKRVLRNSVWECSFLASSFRKIAWQVRHSRPSHTSILGIGYASLFGGTGKSGSKFATSFICVFCDSFNSISWVCLERSLLVLESQTRLLQTVQIRIFVSLCQ